MTRVPEKPSLDGLEARWSERWEADGTYRFDRTKTREEIYSIDTPPPTVSGSLHVGNAFGYAQTDSIVRYRRMRGAEVFYPMGWADNGLATERRVQNYYGVRCDPAGADPGVCRARRAPRRRAVPQAFRRGGDHTALRRAGARRGAPPRRPREGDRHRDDLHLRRRDRRGVVARAATADAQRDGTRRTPRPGAARLGRHRSGRGHALPRAGGQDRQAGPRSGRRAPARRGEPRGRARSDHPSGEVLRARLA